MKHFQEILITLGASSSTLIKESSDWDFWRADYRTPVATVSGYYLYLKHKCPFRESNALNVQNWREASQGNGYDVIVTPQSSLAQNMEQTRIVFHGRQIRTTKQLLLDSFLKDFAWKPIVEEEEYFVDPSVQLENKRTVPDATKFLIGWFGGKVETAKAAPLSILTANGGVGKTTVSRILCGRIHKFDPTAIPILIESDQWRHLLQTTITLDTLWDLALRRAFEQAGRLLANRTALQVLIREGLFIVVFDGFDELCVNASSNYKPQDVIAELLQLLTPEDEVGHAKILLTARETYWDTVKEEIDQDKVEVFRLKGFDNEQKKRFFANRLPLLPERDIALRISKEIGGDIYDGISSEGHNEERFSGVPFILDLIARYVHENADETINPYMSDPFETFLADVCRRESRRQTLDIDPTLQFSVFEELFREYQDSFSIEDLKFYLEVICNVTEPAVIARFTNHVFLTRIKKDEYGPRYEVLRVYFVARFLANGLSKIGERSQWQKIAKILSANSTGKTQLVDWLLLQLRRLEPPRLLAAIKHAREIINDKENQEVQRASSMTLFHLVVSLLEGSDKKERIQALTKFYDVPKIESGWRFEEVTLTGNIRALDLTGCEFIRCRFVDAEFKNCVFDSKSAFRHCVFEGTLSYVNCRGTNELQTSNVSASKEAEYALDEVHNRGSRPELRRAFAEDALNRALKKFRGNAGLTTIQFRHRKSGFKMGNPFNDSVWDELLTQHIVERHPISSVEDGGLNITDGKELHRELISLFDNGILGPRLRQVVDKLVG